MTNEHKLREALEFYADPENYHAIGFRFDRPCGGFADDFSDDHGHEFYDLTNARKACAQNPGSPIRAANEHR